MWWLFHCIQTLAGNRCSPVELLCQSYSTPPRNSTNPPRLGWVMALERASTHDEGSYLGRAALSVCGCIAASPGRAACRHAVGVNPYPGSPGQPEGVALGIYAKSADISPEIASKTRAFETYAAERSHRFSLQHHIAGLLSKHAAKMRAAADPDDAKAAKRWKRPRVSHCWWTAQGQTVQVIRSTRKTASGGKTRRARFGGLQTCGSVWVCPCCSGHISEMRRMQLNALLAWARKEGYAVVMLTLTTRHGKGDSLPDLLNAMKAAKRTWGASYAYKTIKADSLIGTVTATEVTGGGANGWHPHFHMLMLLKLPSQAEALTAAETLRQPWLDAMQKHGLTGSGVAFDVRGASAAGEYVGKWGAAEEITLAGKKRGSSGGMTPMQLADASMNGDKKAGALFVEYANTFHGARQLVWSRGLKELAGVDDATDEQIAEDAARLADETEDETLLGELPPDAWQSVRGHRGRLLERCEEPGPDPLGSAVREIQGYAAAPPPPAPVLTMAAIASALGINSTKGAP